MTKVRVIGATRGQEWYANRIGEVFEISEESHPEGAGVMVYVDGDDGDFCAIRSGNYEVVMENNRKHYIADGKYGATLEREYVEVAEKADVGDYVIKDGIIRKVKENTYGTEGVEFDSYMEYDEEEDEDVEVIGWNHGYYKTLRPTQPEVVRYGGSRYELAERKAEVGELVVVKHNGDIHTVYGRVDLGHISGVEINQRGNWIGDVNEYLVLEPATASVCDTCGGDFGSEVVLTGRSDSRRFCSKECSPNSPKSTEDLLANLARRVASLERENKQLRQEYEDSDAQTEKWADSVNGQLRNLQRNLETFAQETTSTRLLAKQNEKDIVTLDERVNTESQPKAPKITVDGEDETSKESDLMRELRKLLDAFEKEGE